MPAVLFVDDEVPMRRVVQHALTLRGIDIHTAGSLAEARALCGREALDGAVIDVWQTDGVEGLYDVQKREGGMYGRGRITTDAEGRYAFRTVQPVSYPIPDDGPVGKMLRKMGRHPWRPAHIASSAAGTALGWMEVSG